MARHGSTWFSLEAMAFCGVSGPLDASIVGGGLLGCFAGVGAFRRSLRTFELFWKVVALV